MTQRKFKALAILYSNKSLVDTLPLVKFPTDFIGSDSNRRNNFEVIWNNDNYVMSY